MKALRNLFAKLWYHSENTETTRRVEAEENHYFQETGSPINEEQRKFKPVEFIKELPYHPTKQWAKRTLSKIQYLVIHQTLTRQYSTTLQALNRYAITPSPENHLSQTGAPHVPYHFIIMPDGTAFQVNYLDDITWSNAGYNTLTIGASFVGNFTGPSYTGTDKPTPEQIQTLHDLHDYIKAMFPHIELTTHNALGKVNCPGNILMNEVKKINSNNRSK